MVVDRMSQAVALIQIEQAMIDFAQIQTPQDIQVFNQKYNTDLQTPNQVG